VHKARQVRRERLAEEAAASAAAAPGIADATPEPGLRQDAQTTASASGPATPGKPHSHRRNDGS
jgi:hypothetical protein